MPFAEKKYPDPWIERDTHHVGKWRVFDSYLHNLEDNLTYNEAIAFRKGYMQGKKYYQSLRYHRYGEPILPPKDTRPKPHKLI